MPVTIERGAAIAELWRRGEIDWKLRPIQKRIDHAWARSKLVSKTFVSHVSRRVGKSHFWTSKCIQHCLKNKNSKAIYVAPVKDKLKDFITPIINTIIEDAPGDMCPELVGTNLIFNKNGSVINFYGAVNESYKHIRGADADLVVIDEAGFINSLHELLSMIKPVLLRSGGFLGLSSSSPISGDHYFVECIQAAQLGGYYYKATVDEDETLTPLQIETLEKEMGGRNSTAFRREMLCEILTETERALVPEWDDKYIQDLTPTPFWPYYQTYLGMDI